MNRPARVRTRWLLVVVFAIGMAWVEAASVYYLRLLVDRLDPYQANPLPMGGAVRGSALAIPAASGTVDLLVSQDVLQHLPLDGGDVKALAGVPLGVLMN